jgi:hypothetical protein
MKSGYHLFSVEWNQKDFVLKIDEIIYKTVSLDKHFNRSETEENSPENGLIRNESEYLELFDEDFQFVISNVGLNSREFNISEAYVLIDYFKVYEWVTNLDNNTITSCYSCYCGLPAMPPQVVIKRSKNLTPPKRYKNGQIVIFDCYFGSLIGSKFSVCTNGKWNKKSGVCGN